jgi:hypothetical protein
MGSCREWRGAAPSVRQQPRHRAASLLQAQLDPAAPLAGRHILNVTPKQTTEIAIVDPRTYIVASIKPSEVPARYSSNLHAKDR